MTKRRPYKTYPKEFKLEALRLLETSDRPASEIAIQLGIRRNQPYKWKEQMTKKGDVPTGKRGRPKGVRGSGLEIKGLEIKGSVTNEKHFHYGTHLSPTHLFMTPISEKESMYITARKLGETYTELNEVSKQKRTEALAEWPIDRWKIHNN